MFNDYKSRLYVAGRAGKGTLLYKLKLGDILTRLRFNVEELRMKLVMTVWDIGGQTS